MNLRMAVQAEKLTLLCFLKKHFHMGLKVGCKCIT